MKVAHLSEPAEERVIFRDGLGVRERRDTGTGELVEWCHLDPAFASVELPLRERVTRLAKFQHVKFARILSLEPARKDRGPILVSSHVPGSRLSDVLEMSGHGLVTFEPGAGLQILRDVLGALAVLHDSRNVAHGSLGPERVLLTASGRVVMVEHVLGPALDRLQRPRHQLWREWRVPTPPAAGPVRFDMQTDLAQAGLLGLAALLGRPVDEEEYPHRLRGLLPIVQDRLGRSPSAQIATQVVGVLERLAPLDSRRAFKTVREAQQVLEGLFSGGGAALGASPTRIKSVVAAVAALAVAETPVASANDAAQAAAPIVVGAPRTLPDARAVSAPPRVQSRAEATATDGEIDIEALLALEAELEGGSSSAALPPATQPAPASTASEPPAPLDAEPVAPLAVQADDERPLDALAQERLDLERQFAELVASVGPAATDEPVHLIPETPATSEPLVDARVRWSSMPADESETSAPSEAVAPSSDEVVQLSALEVAASAADDDAPVPFADTSVFSRLGLHAGMESAGSVAEEESRPAAAIEHVPANWWKDALPWRDAREPDAEALVSAPHEDASEVELIADLLEVVDYVPAMALAVVEDVAAVAGVSEGEPAAEAGRDSVATAEDLPAVVVVVEATPVLPNDIELTSVVVDATEVDDLVELEPAADVVVVVEPQEGNDGLDEIESVADARDAIEVDAIHADLASLDASPAIDVADVFAAVAVDGVAGDMGIAGVEAATDMQAIDPAPIVDEIFQNEVLEFVDASEFEATVIADAAGDVDVLTYQDESIDAQAGVEDDLELAPAAAAADVTECDTECEPATLAVSTDDAITDIATAPATVIDEACISVADASAVPDVNLGGDDAMAPVGGYRLFGDIEPILLGTDHESAATPEDVLFGAGAGDDSASLAAASLLSRAPGGDDARDWRSSFLGGTRVEDGRPEATGGFFADQAVAAAEFAAESIVELEPIADPAVDWLEIASAPANQELATDAAVLADHVPAHTEVEPAVPAVDEAAVVYAAEDDVSAAPEAPSGPGPTHTDVEEPGQVDERVAAADPDAQALPQELPADTLPIGSPGAADVPGLLPDAVPEIVIVDDGRDGDAWDDLPSELPDVMSQPMEGGGETIPPPAFASIEQPRLSAEPLAAAPGEDHHNGAERDGAAGAATSKKKRRRSRRKKNATPLPKPSPAVVAAPAGAPPPRVPALTSVASEVAPPAAVPVAALPQPLPTPAASVVAAASVATIVDSLPPAAQGGFAPADDVVPEYVGPKGSLLDREVPAWTPPSDFGAISRGFPSSATQPGGSPRAVHVEATAGEADERATGYGGAPLPAATNVVPQAATPMPAPLPPTSSSFGVPDALRGFEAEIRAVGMPDLEEFQTRSGRATVTAVGDAIGTVTTPTGRSGVSSESWGPTTVVQPASSRGTNWKRFIAASVLIALFQGVAFAAWWWVQPGARGTLVVQTAKAGVEVLLDGKVLGRTPFRDEVAPGRHKLGLRQGTNVREMPVEISVGVVTTQALEWPSTAGAKGNLQLTSNPAGAQIVIDGKVRGTTPLLLENLPAGDQVLSLRGDAGSVTVRALVVADETTPLEVKIFAGWILVDAPVEVNLLLNGREKIGSSMDGQILLPPGVHRLRAVNDALGIRQWLSVNVEPGAVERVTLAVPPGTLTLQEEAEVSIDGTAAGTTPGSIHIPPGTHEIAVRLADGTERRQTLTVRAGQRVEF